MRGVASERIHFVQTDTLGILILYFFLVMLLKK